MPGPLWKASVNQLDDRFDLVRQRLDQLIDMENGGNGNGNGKPQNFKVFNNGNTMVEVSIKTRRKPGSDDHRKWDTILSQDDEDATAASKRLPAGTRRRTAGISAEKKYALPTKSSRIKSKKKTVSPLKMAENGGAIMAGNLPPPQMFPHRTLQIFLQEMRSALKQEAVSTAHKILDDLEYVAANLTSSAAPPAITAEETPSGGGGKTTESLHQEQLIERLKREHESHQREAKDLKTKLGRLREEFSLYEAESMKKDQKMSEYKSIINRLTANNNDMLALLTSKADLEESLKREHTKNKKLSKDLANERSIRRAAQTGLLKAKTENAHLSEVIAKLRSSLNLDVKGLREACEEAVAFFGNDPAAAGRSSGSGVYLPAASADQTANGGAIGGHQDTTVDLCISSDHSEANTLSNHQEELIHDDDDVINKDKNDVIKGDNDVIKGQKDASEDDDDEEEDSAIDAGHSEPLSSATTAPPPLPPPLSRHQPPATTAPPLPPLSRHKPVTTAAPLPPPLSQPAPPPLQAQQIEQESSSANEELRLSLGQEIMRIQRESKEMQQRQRQQQMQQQQQQQQQQLLQQQHLQERKEQKQQGASFQAAPLELSETMCSSDISCGPLQDSSVSTLEAPPSYEASVAVANGKLASATGAALDASRVVGRQQSEIRRRQALAQAAAGSVDAKVQEFLHKMRTDKKFQVSLTTSTAASAKIVPDADQADSTINFDFSSESAALTESKFREGLEASLDLTAGTTTDND